MRAVILAGGEGTRLRPLTLDTPKPLAPIAGRSFIAHQLAYLRRHGVDAVTLALTRNAHSERLRAALGDRYAGVTLAYAYEDEPLGSGGAIANAARGWDEPFLVCNGDVVTDLDLTAMVEAHRAAQAELTIALHEVEDPSAYGVVVLDAGDRVVRFVEKPPRAEAPSQLVNAGLWLFEPGLLRALSAERFNRVEDELFPMLASSGRTVLGYAGGGYWRDIGTPATYLQANLDVLAGRVAGWAARSAPGGEDASPGGMLFAPNVTLGRGVALAGGVIVGAGSRVEDGARVEASVLWERVTIGAGAVVRHSVLASEVEVSPGAVLEGRYLGPGERA